MMKTFSILLAVVLTFASAAVVQSQEKSKFAKDEIASFNLDHAKSPEVAKILNEQFLNAITFSANTSTNVIYGRVPAELLPEVKRFIDELEEVAAIRLKEQQIRRDKEMMQRQRGAEQAKQQHESKTKLRFETFQLKFIASLDAFNAIKELGLDGKLAITMEPNSNALLVRGDDKSITDLSKLIQILDVPPQTKPVDEVRAQRLRQAEQELVALEMEFRELLQKFAPNHPKVEMLRQRIGAIEEVLELTNQLDLPTAKESRRESRATPAYENAERKAATLARQWREENDKADSDQAKLDELEAAVTEQVQLAFEHRQRLKKLDMERAAKQLAEIRARLERRERIADEIIARRVQDLIRGDDLTWLSHTTPAADPDGKVMIEALDGGIIMLKGSETDVDRVKKTIQMIERRTVKAGQVTGTVASVNADDKDVFLSIGADDGLKVGDTVSVTRNGVAVGQVQVITVAPDQATARIEATKDGAQIGPGDEVSVVTEDADPAKREPTVYDAAL